MRKSFTFNVVEKKLLLYIGDISIVVFYLYLFNSKAFFGSLNMSEYESVIFVSGIITYSLIAYIIDLYNLERASKPIPVFLLTLTAGILYTLAMFIVAVSIISSEFNKLYLILFLSLMPLSMTVWRLICTNFLIHQPFFKKVIYLYDDEFEKDKINTLSIIRGRKYLNGYNVKLAFSLNNKLFTNNPQRLDKIIRKVDVIIIRVQNYQDLTNQVKKFLTKSLYYGKEVIPFASFYEKTYEALPINLLDNNFYEVLHLKNIRPHFLQTIVAKFIDGVFCTIFGIFLLILIPVVFVLNLFFNKGPLFYTQMRIGKNGKEFKIYKFRSMTVDAEKFGAKMASAKDSRVTPFGKILRSTRIDEIPQIISIIKGDMSVIGPRPERKVFVDQLDKMNPFYSVRHATKPGITGWAQVKYKYGEDLKDSLKKLEYDLYYIKNRSVTLDIRILFKTITTVVFFRGM